MPECIHANTYILSIDAGLTNITIPASVESLERHVFTGCENLKSVTYKGFSDPVHGAEIFKNTQVETVNVPAGYTDLSFNAVYLNGTLFWTQSYCGPYDLYVYQGGVMGNTPLLVSLTEMCSSTDFILPVSSELALPDELTKIKEEAFADTDIERVIVPAAVTEIGSRAFANCEPLHYVIFEGDSITIAEEAFEDCKYIVFACKEGSDAAAYAASNEQFGFVYK